MKTPTKENYLDRYIPSRSNAKWKNPSFEVSKCLFQSNSQPFPSGLRENEGSNSSLSGTSISRPTNAQPTTLRGSHSNPNFSSVLGRNGSDSAITDHSSHFSVVSTLVHNELVENNITPDNNFGAGASSNEAAIFTPRENLNIFSVSRA